MFVAWLNGALKYSRAMAELHILTRAAKGFGASTAARGAAGVFRRARPAWAVGALGLASLLIAGCAAGASGGRDVVAGLGTLSAEEFDAGDADVAEVERALDVLFYHRDEFEPRLCQSAHDGSFAALIGGELYSVPIDVFVVGRPERGRAGAASAGCPESPFHAAALTLAPNGASGETDALHVTVVGDDRRFSLYRRSATVLALAGSEFCRPADDAPGFYQCDIEERIFAIAEPITYFFAATADAPVIAGAPFSIRCVSRRVARPCSIVDRLDDNALIGIDYDPAQTSLSEVFDIHKRARELARSLQRGLPI